MLGACAVPVHAGLLGTNRPDGMVRAFGLGPEQAAYDYTVQEIACAAPANVLWPGDKTTFTLQFANRSATPLRLAGKVDLVSYGTAEPSVLMLRVFKIADLASIPINLDIPPGEFQDVTVPLPIPERFGAYALVADLGEHGRALAAGCVRVPRPDPGQVQLPTFSLDVADRCPEEWTLLSRLGVKGARMEIGYTPTTSKAFPAYLANLAAQLDSARLNDVTVMLTPGAGGPQPLGRGRPFLDSGARMTDWKQDMAWLPSSDGDYQEFVKTLAGKFGWPNGPVDAIELWNEPWDGMSISGWGADIPRYREIYTAMAQGVEEARKESGVQVLTGGCSSSMNTDDKLFCDGTDTFLKWLDFTTVHYQPMDNMPALIPEWVNRQSPRGPVRTWDTETWMANSEDRVAAFVASERAEGLSRVSCTYHENVRDVQKIRIRTDTGIKPATIIQTWSVAAAIAAAQKFIGQRSFNRLLFRNGLPWIFVFNGPNRPDDGTVSDRQPSAFSPQPSALSLSSDDGTVVVVGDLGGIYDRNLLLFRSVGGLQGQEKVAELERQMAALPATAPWTDRYKLRDELLDARMLSGASMTLPDGGGSFILYDDYGNPIPAENGKIVVPLDGVGRFLRTDGSPGSFAKLLQAIQASRIDGYEPVEIVAHDMLAPINKQPALRLTLTNILNRPVTGKLSAKLGDLTLDQPDQTVTLQPNETTDVLCKVTAGTPAASNTYSLTAVFDAGADGKVTHAEEMHVNLIARKTIKVDGDLSDWAGAMPEPVQDPAVVSSIPADADFQPASPFGGAVQPGLSVAYLAYDDNNFYFAAKVADDTPYEGNLRFATRDDDQFFYPDKVYASVADAAVPKPRSPGLDTLMQNLFQEGADVKPGEIKAQNDAAGATEWTWPAGVRHYSYRKTPVRPSGTGTDNIVLGFGVIPEGQNGSLLNPPGTMPRFMSYKCTDYEYALNQVAPEYGGGTEVWRLIAPGVPRKHYTPREPKAAIDGGPVAGAQLVVKRDGNTRIVECAIPWTEMPEVQKRMAAGQPIRFTFRVNDNGLAVLSHELAEGRSVSKMDNYALHDFWLQHWANEVEFGVEK